MKRKIGIMGLLGAVLMMGLYAQAAVIVFDGFDTGDVADPANGIYLHDAGINTNAPVGGTIVGFSTNYAWIATSSFLRAHNGALLGLTGYDAQRIGSRQLADGTMTGKTVAYGSVGFNLNLVATNDYTGAYTKIGFSTDTATSSRGATMRLRYSGDQWIIEVVYNNGAAVAQTVMSGISLKTDYNLIWEMDSVNDTLKVWVNATSATDTPTATFTDYLSSVEGIEDAYVQYINFGEGDNSWSLREGVRYDNLILGDTMADVYSEPPVVSPLIAFDGFDTTAEGDSSNGIYKHDIGLGYLPNADPTGGNIVGFEAARGWLAGSSYFRTYNNQLVLLPLSSTSRIVTRQLAAGPMSGKTVAYGSVDFTINCPSDSGSSKIGFTTQTATSSVGATMRLIWDTTNSEWDLQAVYYDGVAITVGAVMDGISLYTDYTVIWGMDETADTLNVWVNATSTNDAATATFTDYSSSVSTIDDAYVQYNGMTNSVVFRDGLTYDNLALGDTMAAVFSGPTGGYAEWADGWGVDIGASTNDYDSDGLLNLYEYGLGGDPTNVLDQGTSPEFGIENVGGTNWFGYVHPQLSDSNSGLSYSLELNTDLVSGTWANAGYIILGTNVTGGELDFVTNVTDTVAGEKFIRLIIE